MDRPAAHVQSNQCEGVKTSFSYFPPMQCPANTFQSPSGLIIEDLHDIIQFSVLHFSACTPYLFMCKFKRRLQIPWSTPQALNRCTYWQWWHRIPLWLSMCLYESLHSNASRLRSDVREERSCSSPASVSLRHAQLAYMTVQVNSRQNTHSVLNMQTI